MRARFFFFDFDHQFDERRENQSEHIHSWVHMKIDDIIWFVPQSKCTILHSNQDQDHAVFEMQMFNQCFANIQMVTVCIELFFAIHSILLIQWRTLNAYLFAKRQIYNFMDSSQWQIEACDNERYGCIKINDRKGVCCKCSRKWMCVFAIFDSVHQFNATQLNSIRMNHRCMKWNCSKFIFTIFVPMLSKVLFVHPITPIVTLHWRPTISTILQ